MSALEPRVYVACLACYNAGTLHGHWLDADDCLPDAHREAFELNDQGFAPCGGEEFIVHDYEGFGAFKLGEVSVSEAAEAGQALRDAGDRGEVLAALRGHGISDKWPELLEYLEENCAGQWESLEDWAQEHFLEMFPEKEWPVPPGLPSFCNYVDWEAVARDMGGDIFSLEIDGETHVFWSR